MSQQSVMQAVRLSVCFIQLSCDWYSVPVQLLPGKSCLGNNLLCVECDPLLDNIRVMVIVWRLRGNIIGTALCWVV